MAKLLPTLTIAGTRYTVLRLDGDVGPRYLLRAPRGELFGLFPMNGQPTRFRAQPLAGSRDLPNPFAAIEFSEEGRRLVSSFATDSVGRRRSP